jgi:hypothetical protein
MHVRALALLVLLVSLVGAEPTEKARWWSDEVEQSLGRAGENRPELVKALTAIPIDQRKHPAS